MRLIEGGVCDSMCKEVVRLLVRKGVCEMEREILCLRFWGNFVGDCWGEDRFLRLWGMLR